MVSTHYDSLPLNEDMLLDLPFREGTGALTHDVGRYHHNATLVNSPGWTTEPSGLGTLWLNGLNKYGEIAGADTADLNFLAGDYSIGAWIKWTNTMTSEIIIGRYEVDVSGWEVYLTKVGSVEYLTLRHHHAGGAATRTACYSVGWTNGTWLFMGISRSGSSSQHYKNGVALDMTCSVGGLIDPETCAQDVVIGTRYTKNTNWYSGRLWRPRVWGRALSAAEWRTLYELERGWF